MHFHLFSFFFFFSFLWQIIHLWGGGGVLRKYDLYTQFNVDNYEWQLKPKHIQIYYILCNISAPTQSYKLDQNNVIVKVKDELAHVQMEAISFLHGSQNQHNELGNNRILLFS